MMKKKGMAWQYVVGMIIGLILLVTLIMMASQSSGKMGELIFKIKQLLG